MNIIKIIAKVFVFPVVLLAGFSVASAQVAPTITLSVDNPTLYAQTNSPTDIPDYSNLPTTTVRWSSTGVSGCVWNSWDFHFADDVMNSPYTQSAPNTGSRVVYVSLPYGWTVANMETAESRIGLKCATAGGVWITKDVKVKIIAVPPSGPVPTIEISASPASPRAFVDRTNPAAAFNDATTTLTWRTTNASSCHANYLLANNPTQKWKGQKDLNGSQELHFVHEYPDFTYYWNGGNSYNFSLTCIGSGRMETTKSINVILQRLSLIEPETKISEPFSNTEFRIGDSQVITWETTGVNFGTFDSRSINRIMLSGKSASDPYGAFRKYTIAKDIPVSGSVTWKVGEVVPGSADADHSGMVNKGVFSDATSVPPGTYDMFITIMGDNSQGDAVSYGQVKKITIAQGTGGTPPVCAPPRVMVSGVCTTPTTPPVCTATSSICPPPTCVLPKVLVNNVCTTPTPPSCPTLYWRDTSDKTCSAPKQFCGTYMYFGLETFSTKQSCLDGVSPSTPPTVPATDPTTPTWPLPTTPATPAQSAIAAQIALLKAKIAAMREGTTVPASQGSVVAPSQGATAAQSCTMLTKNLSYRSTDAKTEGQVTLFQQFLINDGYLTTSTFGYFGPATLKATKAFQRTEGINPTGYVGPLTRAKIQALSCQ